ncbi:MAG: UTP--glucose-1-phosphate uridylyltransferase GalU [Clostridia bacterium]|nr:UTP--glucose-1-phosphate uridylyltransferase GalU [Clostridia bacterium]MBQ3554394.1 UTP--glucose-1-phosphate uridylyltransferase GalU [Clostridia bacterium]
MATIRKAVIPAAGLGTRFLPATKAVPKEMIPIVDKPTIQYIIEEAAASGITDLLIITSRTKKCIEDHFDKSYELETELEKSGKTAVLEEMKQIRSMMNIQYVRQAEPKGLGHAIYCAKSFVGNEPFAVLLGDDVVYNAEKPCLSQMIEMYDKYRASVLGVQSVPESEVNKYGIVSGEQIADRMWRVHDMVEKPKREEAPTNVAVLGRYIITPEIFTHLENTKPGAGGEIQLTDALKTLAKEQEMYAYDFIGRRYDVGNKMGFLEATVEYALRRKDLSEEFMKYLKEVVSK